MPRNSPRVGQQREFVVRSSLCLLYTLYLPVYNRILGSLLVLFPQLSHCVIGIRHTRHVSGHTHRTNVDSRQSIRISNNAASLMAVIRFANDRVLKGVSRRISLFLVRRLRYLKVSLFAKPVGANILRAVLNGRLTKASYHRGVVSLLLRRANHLRRVRFLLQYSNEGRGLLLQSTVARKGRDLRRNAKDVTTGTARFANQDRVRSRCEINFLRTIRERLTHLSPSVVRFRRVLLQLLGERTRRSFHNGFSGVSLRCLTSRKRQATNAGVALSRLCVVIFDRVLGIRQTKSVRHLNCLAASTFGTAGHLCVRLLQQGLSDNIAKVCSHGLGIFKSYVDSSFAILYRDVRLRLLNVFSRLTSRCQVLLQCINHRLRGTFRLFLIKTCIRYHATRRVQQASGRERACLVSGQIGILR